MILTAKQATDKYDVQTSNTYRCHSITLNDMIENKMSVTCHSQKNVSLHEKNKQSIYML